MTPHTALAALVVLISSLTAAAPVAAQSEGGASVARYREMTVAGAAGVRSLQQEHGTEGFRTILHVNRLDLEHIRDGATLIVPDPASGMAAVSPFPGDLETLGDIAPRLVVVSRRVQAFAVYEQGRQVRWGAVSTGRKETPTPAGLFATNWKSKLRRSSDNAEWLLPWYVNFINASGVSFHQFALPGYPASHACVRLMADDARWIYDWAESWVLADGGRRIVVHGTPVVVFGDYAFEQPAPWLRLPLDPAATRVPLTELQVALEPHRVAIAAREVARTEWLSTRGRPAP